MYSFCLLPHLQRFAKYTSACCALYHIVQGGCPQYTLTGLKKQKNCFVLLVSGNSRKHAQGEGQHHCVWCLSSDSTSCEPPVLCKKK